MKLIFSKGPALSIRLLIAIILSVGLIVIDRNYHPFIKLRSYLDTFVSPFYYIINEVTEVKYNLSELVENKEDILAKNRALTSELIAKNSDLLLLNQLKHENTRLRELLGSPLRNDELKKVAQVLSNESGFYSNQVVINKGSNDDVFVGQSVIDEKGIVGQVYAVAQKTSRVILLCDTQHGLPVQVVRNDTRVIAVGNGCNEDLVLEFLPDNIDIQVGDELVTSGLDGRFTEGYPVAIVSSVTKDAQSGHLIITATPTAGLKQLRYLLLLWAKQDNSSLQVDTDE